MRDGEGEEREAEGSEEDEAGYADDPLVLKGSRVEAPPEKNTEGTEVSARAKLNLHNLFFSTVLGRLGD